MKQKVQQILNEFEQCEHSSWNYWESPLNVLKPLPDM